MNNDEARRPVTPERVARALRAASLGTDAVVVVAVVAGQEDVGTCAGALSAALRCAAGLLEGSSRR